MPNLNIQGTFTTPTGQLPINMALPVNAPIGSQIQQALSSGANTITIPAGTTYVIVQLPIGNAIAVTLKGVTGDTGLTIRPDTGVIVYSPLAGATSFVLTAGSAIAALTSIIFI